MTEDELVQEALVWLVEGGIEDASNDQVKRIVNMLYPDGWEQFVKDYAE